MDQNILFQDEGIKLTERQKKKALRLPQKRGLMTIDPVCLSCNHMQSDIIKKFKIACLAYAPSSVVFRNAEFTRQ